MLLSRTVVAAVNHNGESFRMTRRRLTIISQQRAIRWKALVIQRLYHSKYTVHIFLSLESSRISTELRLEWIRMCLAKANSLISCCYLANRTGDD